MMLHTLDECCTRCEDHDRRYCRDETGTCPDCDDQFQSCGRLDDHDPHEWSTHQGDLWARYTTHCPGEVVIEGGYFAEGGAL